MGIAFFALGAVLYLALVIDWKEMIEVMRGGAWPAVSIYFILILLIAYALTCPVAMNAGGGHH